MEYINDEGVVDGVYKYSIEQSLHEFAAATLPFRYSEFLDVN